MPIYEYRCNNFSGHKEYYGREQVHNFEVLQLSRDGTPKCPICDSTNVEYLPSSFAFRKGSQRKGPRVQITDPSLDELIQAAKDSQTGIATSTQITPIDENVFHVRETIAINPKTYLSHKHRN